MLLKDWKLTLPCPLLFLLRRRFLLPAAVPVDELVEAMDTETLSDGVVVVVVVATGLLRRCLSNACTSKAPRTAARIRRRAVTTDRMTRRWLRPLDLPCVVPFDDASIDCATIAEEAEVEAEVAVLAVVVVEDDKATWDSLR